MLFEYKTDFKKRKNSSVAKKIHRKNNSPNTANVHSDTYTQMNKAKNADHIVLLILQNTNQKNISP